MMQVKLRVLSSRNAVLASVTARCPSGVKTVGLDLTLSSDTTFSMPMNISADPTAAGTLTLAKDNVDGDGLSSLVLVPCEVWCAASPLARALDGSRELSHIAP